MGSHTLLHYLPFPTVFQLSEFKIARSLLLGFSYSYLQHVYFQIGQPENGHEKDKLMGRFIYVTNFAMAVDIVRCKTLIL